MLAKQTAHTETIGVDANELGTGVVQSAIDPATIAAFAALGAQVLHFAGQLIGGKTGNALSGIANEINGIGYKIQNVANQLEGLLTGVQQVIESMDKAQLAKVWPVHNQVMSYRAAFPPGSAAPCTHEQPKLCRQTAAHQKPCSTSRGCGARRLPSCRRFAMSQTPGWKSR